MTTRSYQCVLFCYPKQKSPVFTRTNYYYSSNLIQFNSITSVTPWRATGQYSHDLFVRFVARKNWSRPFIITSARVRPTTNSSSRGVSLKYSIQSQPSPCLQLLGFSTHLLKYTYFRSPSKSNRDRNLFYAFLFELANSLCSGIIIKSVEQKRLLRCSEIGFKSARPSPATCSPF